MLCGNNPVSRIDPDGRYWKDDKDERKADRIAKRREKANGRLVKKMGTVDSKIAKATAKGDLAVKFLLIKSEY